MLAAYPEAQTDLSQHDLAVATIYGDQDGLVSLEEIESSFQLLPTTAVKLMIAGGNHAQFGFYGDQAGDQSALISREAASASPCRHCPTHVSGWKINRFTFLM